MSNNPPIVPGPGAFGSDEADEAGLREVDGEIVLDGDANEDLVDSADADLLAATDPDDDAS
jgi:hypothetical protein